MKIDIEPIIEPAGTIDKICMEMRELEALYVVRLANGKDFTVKWDKKELATFQPNKTISEMIQTWEEGIQRRYYEALEAVESGLHPTETVLVPIMITLAHGGSYPSKNTTRVRKELDRYQKRHFKKVIETLPEQFGKMQFIKIV